MSAEEGRRSPTARRKKAYEEVAIELRGRIVAGSLTTGDRLPNETVLANDFGVSRATVREALRLLAAQDLIRTAKGAGGGSYVTVPRVGHISDFLHLEPQPAHLGQAGLDGRAARGARAARGPGRAAGRRPAPGRRRRATAPGDPADEPQARPRGRVLEQHRVPLGRPRPVREHAALDRRAAGVRRPDDELHALVARPRLLPRDPQPAPRDRRRDRGRRRERGRRPDVRRHLEFLRPTYQKIWRKADERSRP